MKNTHRFAVALFILCITACNVPANPAKPIAQTSGPDPTVTLPRGVAGNVNIIFTNGHIITMDDAKPLPEAIAIGGDSILAVGTNDEIDAYRGPNTILVDLDGKTLTPGFIDSHQYRIQKRTNIGVSDAGTIIQTAIEQGWTTLDELYVDPGVMDELLNLDQAGTLRVRINAYLPFMEYNATGSSLGDWYEAYRQGQIISPHVRVAGLVGFADYDNANIMLWKQDDLNAFLFKAQQEGWAVALKTVSTRSVEMILKGFEYVQSADPTAVNSRGRLEHALFITPDQIARIKQLGLIPIINLNNPGQLVGEQDIDQLITREPEGSYTPWHSLVQAGIPIANGTGWPSYYVDEPSGAPFGSPMHLIYQGVARVGNLGVQPYPWLLDQTITAEQSMRALTTNSAYASFEENVKGSLAAGKLADLVILSDDPLSVPTEQINTIQVLMTMIGGKPEYCMVGYETLCPSVLSGGQAPAPATKTSYPSVTASTYLPESPPSKAIDGDIETIWNSGAGPEQWIQIDLGQPAIVSAIRLVISQYPQGETVHQLWAGNEANSLTLIHEFRGFTTEPNTLEFQPSPPLTDIRYIKVLTTQSPSWVAWREIEITMPSDK